MSRVSELWNGLSPNARRGVVGGTLGVLAIGLIAAVALGGGDAKDDAAPKPTTTTTRATTTVPPVVTTTTEPKTGAVAPLTGLRVTNGYQLLRPALAVKIDNLDAPGESAVPQSGLPKADIVFEEVVEGNITRLVGVFHSQNPGRVGPVRSARSTDVELLPMLRNPLLAWSGGNEGVTAAVHGSPWITDVGYNQAPGSYARDGSRRAPHNLYVQADELWSKAPAGLPFPSPLFKYRAAGEENTSIAREAQGVDIDWGSHSMAPVSWRWDPKSRVYLRTQRGRQHKDADGTPLSAKNVVVMALDYSMNGNSPVGHTVGSGEAFLYTNGRVVHGSWSRPDIGGRATFLDDKGQPFKLSPGQTWIEMPRAGGATTINF